MSLHQDTYEYLDRQRDARDHEFAAFAIAQTAGCITEAHTVPHAAELAAARRLRARERARFAASYARRWLAERRALQGEQGDA